MVIMDDVLQFAQVSSAAIDVPHVMALVCDPRAGAVATFVGAVRNHDGGRDVAGLSYSAHPSAQDTLAHVAQEFADRPGVHRLAVAHRIGDLEIGDVALFAAVSASHRAEAFPVLEELVNRIKAAVPIWKHQEYADGTKDWPGSTDQDSSAGPSSADSTRGDRAC